MKLTALDRWIRSLIMADSTFEEYNLATIRAYQLGKIRQTLAYAKDHSNFYRERLGGINPGIIRDFRTFEEKVPFTSPQELIQRPGDFLAVPQYLVSRIVTLKSSGSLGPSKRIFFTDEDLERTIDFFHQGMKHIVSQGDQVLILMPGNYYGSIGDLLKKGLARMGCGSIIHWPMIDVGEVLETLACNNIDSIVGLPVEIYKLARMKNASPKYRGIKLKSVLMSGDYVARTIVGVVEKSFNCQVFTHYGMTEMGFAGGVECSCRSGYHIREGDLYLEIIHPDTGQILPYGQEGEIVFTSLTRQAMPLIRYRTGDRASFKASPCNCSSNLPVMAFARGRLEEELEIGSVRINIGDLDEALFTLENLLDYKATIANNTIKIWTKSLNANEAVNQDDIDRVFDKTHIGGLVKRGQLRIKHKGERNIDQPADGMLKRRFF